MWGHFRSRRGCSFNHQYRSWVSIVESGVMGGSFRPLKTTVDCLYCMEEMTDNCASTFYLAFMWFMQSKRDSRLAKCLLAVILRTALRVWKYRDSRTLENFYLVTPPACCCDFWEWRGLQSLLNLKKIEVFGGDRLFHDDDNNFFSKFVFLSFILIDWNQNLAKRSFVFDWPTITNDVGYMNKYLFVRKEF